jgi:hypothetical protein
MQHNPPEVQAQEQCHGAVGNVLEENGKQSQVKFQSDSCHDCQNLKHDCYLVGGINGSGYVIQSEVDISQYVYSGADCLSSQSIYEVIIEI